MENNQKNTYFESALKNYIEAKKTGWNYLSTNYVNYLTLTDFLFTDMILCNNITDIDSDFIFNVVLSEERDEDEDYYNEFYQYYIVNIDDWRLEKYEEYLKEKKQHTNIHLFYSGKLECYVLGVNHFGTSWRCVYTDIKITEDNEEGEE